MLNKYEVCQCHVIDENSRNILYRYYLVESNKLLNYNEFKVNVVGYGIYVSSEVLENGEQKVLFEDSIEFLSIYKDKILKFIDFLASNKVSPIHLIDIVSMYSDEWIGDFEKELKQKFLQYAIA